MNEDQLTPYPDEALLDGVTALLAEVAALRGRIDALAAPLPYGDDNRLTLYQAGRGCTHAIVDLTNVRERLIRERGLWFADQV